MYNVMYFCIHDDIVDIYILRACMQRHFWGKRNIICQYARAHASTV